MHLLTKLSVVNVFVLQFSSVFANFSHTFFSFYSMRCRSGVTVERVL